MRTTIKGCAEAFIAGQSAHTSNARTNGNDYFVNGAVVAQKHRSRLRFSYKSDDAAHMQHVEAIRNAAREAAR